MVLREKSGSRLNSKLPLKAYECRGLRWTDLGYGLGILRAPGLETPVHTFAAPLLRLEPQWKGFHSPGAPVQSNNKWSEARESCTLSWPSMLLPLPTSHSC